MQPTVVTVSAPCAMPHGSSAEAAVGQFEQADKAASPRVRHQDAVQTAPAMAKSDIRRRDPATV